jgi:hypothetical protein
MQTLKLGHLYGVFFPEYISSVVKSGCMDYYC